MKKKADHRISMWLDVIESIKKEFIESREDMQKYWCGTKGNNDGGHVKMGKPHRISSAAKKGFLAANRHLADEAFRDNMPNDLLIERARRELRYSPRTSTIDIWISLHLTWRMLDQ